MGTLYKELDASKLRAPAILSFVLALVVGLLSIAPAVASSNGVVISEFRVDGPGSASNEFVELRNTSDKPVNIKGWRLEGCAAASGNPSTRVTVTQDVTLAPGGHFLFTNTGYIGSVPGDATYGTGIANEGGMRIVTGNGTVVDGVAHQDTGTDQCREGTGLNFRSAANPDYAFARKSTDLGGLQDTDNNAADFDSPSGSPENSGSPPQPPTTITKIHEIQGSGQSSPKDGQKVTIEGVVAGIDDEVGASFGSNNTIRKFPEDAGIFVQEEDSDVDSDPNTSEGIFVGFVRDRAAYPPGTKVRLNGRVDEKFDQTIISETINQEPQDLGAAPVPAPVTIDQNEAESQDPATRPYYERLEGMRVELETGTANSGGTNKFGELFLTLGTEQDRVFRTEDPPDLIATVDDAGAGDPDNPYRPEQQSTTAVEADLFDRVDDAVGPLSFTFDHYKVVVQPGNLPTVADTGVVYPYSGVAPAASKQLRVASFNFENYFPVGGALDGGNITQAEFDEKTARLTDAIDDLLERPDVVAVQEVYDLPTLQALATSLGGYTAYLEEGNDARGIDVGFLVKDTVTVRGMTQYGKTATGPEGFDCSDVPGGLFDRPPLALEIQAKGFGEFTIFSNHFASKAAPDECRAAQAAFVRDRVAELEEAGKRSIVAGDLNAFEDESALATLEDGTTTLDNLWDRAPAEERYSFAFQGKLQTLDHVLLTRGLQSKVGDFRYAHFDNDYYEREDPADGHKISDHDPPVLTLSRGNSK